MKGIDFELRPPSSDWLNVRGIARNRWAGIVIAREELVGRDPPERALDERAGRVQVAALRHP